MSKYRDIKKIGKSKTVPFIPGESSKSRHDRRFDDAQNNKKSLESSLSLLGWALVVKNHGHHWIARYGNSVIEWWPISAKAIINKKWEKGIHVHDTSQLLTLIMTLNKKDIK